MPPNPAYDLPVAHIDAAHHRRAAAPKHKEMKPLLTRDPLPHDREKRPVAQHIKKRKRVVPTTSVFTFDPKHSNVPTGKQDPPVSPSVYSRPSTSESSASSYDEQQTAPFLDRESSDQFHNGYDAQKRPRIFTECSSIEHSASFYSDTPCTEGNEISSIPPPSDFYNSPMPYTSPSPALPDQFPCPAELAFQATQTHSGQEYVHQPVVPQDFSYHMSPFPDGPAQGYPMQHSGPVYGRPAPHGIPAYPDSNSYSYPGRRY